MSLRFVAAFALCLSALPCVFESRPSAAADEGLRTLAAAVGLPIGTALAPGGLDDDAYMDLAARHFSILVPEYGLYMSQLQPAPGVWDFGDADAVAAFAAEHVQMLRGHALIWGLPIGARNPFGGWRPTPGWVHESELSRSEAIAVMKRQIETVMARYRGQARDWIVVNEALGSHDVDGVRLSPTIWLETIGPDYIALAFEHARQVDPSVRLILNDYGADYLGQHGGSDRVDDYYDLLAYLLAAGAPIDGVGFQFHLSVEYDAPTVAQIADNMARYQALGLSTHITELDVRIPAPVTDAKLRKQEELYETVLHAVIQSGVADVTLWGFTDRYSWIVTGETFENYPVGTLLDSELAPHPAFAAVRNLFERHSK